MHEVGQQQLRDIDQHQAYEDLTGTKARAQKCRYRRPSHATEHGCNEHRGQLPEQAKLAYVEHKFSLLVGIET